MKRVCFKKFALTFALFFSAVVLTAQVPAGFTYQAVVRNNDGEVVANQDVRFRFTILQGSETGIPVYTETQDIATNDFGLANLNIGKGTVIDGIFSPGGWGLAAHFLKIELDAEGGSDFVHLGTMELMSVPYAFHAQTVEVDQVDDADADATNELQELELSGTVLGLSKSSKTVILPSSGGGDNWGTQVVQTDTTLTGEGTDSSPLGVVQTAVTPEWDKIQGIPEGFADGIDDAGDADNDALNEIQTLSISGTQLSLSKEGGTVTLPSSGDGGDNWGTDVVHTDATLEGQGTTALPLKVAQQSATTGQVLKWDGSKWTPEADENEDDDSDAANELQDLSLEENILKLTESTATLDLSSFMDNTDSQTLSITENNLSISGGNSVALPSSGGGGDNWGSDYVHTDATLEGQGTTALPLKMAQQSAATGQVLKWSGSAWYPGDDESGSSLWLQNGSKIYYNSGFVGIGTSNPDTPLEVASSGIPIIKLNNTSSNAGNVQKITFWKGSTEKFAIGYDLWGTGDDLFTLFDTPNTLPVLNIKNGNTGIGTTDPGAKLEVAGQVKITGGSPADGKVLTSDANGLASWQIPGSSGLTLPYSGTVTNNEFAFKVINDNTSSGYGIFGKGMIGIHGESDAVGGTGVEGSGSINGVSGTGDSRGVFGSSGSTTGKGVMGWSLATSGECYGVYGQSESSSGVGVYGTGKTAFEGETSASQGYGIYVKCTDASSVTRGVYASVSSPTGYSGYFTGGRFYVGGNVGIGTVTPDYRLEVYAPGTGSTGIAGFYNSAGDIKAIIRQTTNGGGQFNLYNSEKTATVTLLGEGESFINGGNLGIGTTNPSFDLDVYGNIRATGAVYYGDPAAMYTRPDYVFGEDYSILEPEDVEEFIKKENHLPWVTSAKEEKKENGDVVNMTRMAFETLEAAENIQLQVISQNKKIRTLEAENNRLKEENKRITNRLERLEKTMQKKFNPKDSE